MGGSIRKEETDKLRAGGTRRRSTWRRPVDSSAIMSIGYDGMKRTLDIEFEGGAVYRYFDVPPDIHLRLMNASSKGRFVNDKIKDEYRYEHLA